MKFIKGNVVVEIGRHGHDETRISAGDKSWPFFTDEQDHGGVALTHADADDVLAALWVSHLARQNVDRETLRIGAEVQGVTITDAGDTE